MADDKVLLDHQQIGTQQELFMFSELSPGCPIFLPNGVIIYNNLMDFLRKEYFKRGFKEVKTPMMFKQKLWEISGHLDKYKQNMFQFTDGEKDQPENENEKQNDKKKEKEKEKEKETEPENEKQNSNHTFFLKPMQCPIHCLIFDSKLRSYKELPLRYADFGVLHRNEYSGALSKLTRVRSFSQDDAHIFCTDSQIGVEIDSCLDFLKYVYGKFGFEFELKLSTRPDNYIGDLQSWQNAETQLGESLNKFGKEWKLSQGDGAFYGPKIDVHIKDASGKKHQCATIQLDFQLPIRFDLKYKDDKDQFKRPVIIHRAIYGSFERFIGILCEHLQGKWPFWLSPRQVDIIPVSEKFVDYANVVCGMLRMRGYHAEVDASDNSVSKKIREGKVEKFNYLLVVGQKEVDSNTVSVVYRDSEEKKTISVESFLNELAHL